MIIRSFDDATEVQSWLINEVASTVSAVFHPAAYGAEVDADGEGSDVDATVDGDDSAL